MQNALRIRHKKSAVVGKVPSASTIDYGEIAVNYNDNSPSLYIKTNQDRIERFISGSEFDSIVGVGFGTGGTITDVVDEKYEKPSSGIPASDIEPGVIPTISTNIKSDRSSNTKTASPKAVYDEQHPMVVYYRPANGFEPNITYVLGTLTGSITFTLMTPDDPSIVNHYYWTFDTSSTAPSVTMPQEIVRWNKGLVPIINPNKHYEFSVLNGTGSFMEA